MTPKQKAIARLIARQTTFLPVSGFAVQLAARLEALPLRTLHDLLTLSECIVTDNWHAGRRGTPMLPAAPVEYPDAGR